MPQQDLVLLLRLNKSWHDGISAENLYEIARAWWVMSPANAQRVARVLAVAGGVVREVYQPVRWLPSPVEGLENRIRFEGVVADRESYSEAVAETDPIGTSESSSTHTTKPPVGGTSCVTRFGIVSCKGIAVVIARQSSVHLPSLSPRHVLARRTGACG